ncbi:hypothetical protein [Pseudoalteromonas aurantia]|uniref:Uncharacterized protein n=2 Tax=Pseudoalteromonas TaxID=53246 RepID=A0ABY2VUJ7_9GAMM|nr:hypothetical protein [Pseudoalteromonas aurantia]TMO71991.1 hypothetical protein CWC20_16170 [Pseudoalteromonas aurantia]
MTPSTLRFFSGLALFCFLSVVIINICSHFGIVIFKSITFFFQAFVILMAIPLVNMCNKTMPNGSNGNLVHIFSATNGKYLFVLALITIYGFINFFYFIHKTKPFPRGEAPTDIVSGIFSSLQMVFVFLEYIIASALLKITYKHKVI